MLNLLTVMGTRTVAAQLTKPMKILNVIKNLLTIIGLGVIAAMITLLAVTWNSYTPESIFYVVSLGVIAFIVIPAIQLTIKHFTTMDVPLTEKQKKKLLKKYAKYEYKINVNMNKKMEKKTSNKDFKDQKKILKKNKK